MNFSGIDHHTFTGKLLRLPLRLIPPSMVVPIIQGRLKGKKWIVGSGDHGCWLGSYEYEKVAAFEASIEPGDIVFDLGANVGYYTILSSCLTGPTGRVFAFEPSSQALFYLKRHIELNHVKNVEVYETAVSNTSGKARFELGCSLSSGKLSSGGTVEVSVACLDDLYMKDKLPLPDVVKIDVEGGEYGILQGAQRVLQDGAPTLFLATHGREIHDACCRLLVDAGYEVSGLPGEKVDDANELVALKKGLK